MSCFLLPAASRPGSRIAPSPIPGTLRYPREEAGKALGMGEEGEWTRRKGKPPASRTHPKPEARSFGKGWKEALVSTSGNRAEDNGSRGGSGGTGDDKESPCYRPREQTSSCAQDSGQIEVLEPRQTEEEPRNNKRGRLRGKAPTALGGRGAERGARAAGPGRGAPFSGPPCPRLGRGRHLGHRDSGWASR